MLSVERILAIVPAYITHIHHNDDTVQVVNIYSELTNLQRLLRCFKYSSLFKARTLVDIIVIDNPHRIQRFEIIFMLLSSEYDVRFVVKCGVKELDYIESFQSLFANAAWLEREV